MFDRVQNRYRLLACLLVASLGVAGAAGRATDSETVAAQVTSSAQNHRYASTRRGLWVLCEGSQRILEHPERVETLFQQAKLLGATDLFLQLYRGGRAWFDSSHADTAPFERMKAAWGKDPLPDFFSRAHAQGLRVHAWVNVLSLASNREAPVVQALGRAVVANDRKGRSVLDYPEFELPEPEAGFLRMGTPALWLDPAAPGVSAWLAGTFAELVRRYPQLDGLHFDYLRYPDVLPFIPGSRFGIGLDFGYGAASRARFTGETGLEAPFQNSLANANEWDDWRRDKLSELLAVIQKAVRRSRPTLRLSAAVWAYPERAYLSLFQDWRGWLERNLLDFAVPMLYTRDMRLFRYESKSYVSGIAGDRVWIGMGSWLFAKEPADAVAQIELVRGLGASGHALFSYDAIADSQPLRQALNEEAARARN